MKTFKVKVYWQMCGYVEVQAENIEEAKQFVKEDPSVKLPTDGEYLEGSWEVEEE